VTHSISRYFVWTSEEEASTRAGRNERAIRSTDRSAVLSRARERRDGACIEALRGEDARGAMRMQASRAVRRTFRERWRASASGPRR